MPAGWKIERSLEQIIISSTVASEIDSNDTINDIGYIQTMFPDEGDEATSATTAGAFSTDDDFSDGFTMEFVYAFKDRVEASNSYVQAYGIGDKYSFVANSGIKFGTAVRPSDNQTKDYEIAILDIDSMVEVAGGSTGDIDFYYSGVNAGKTSNSGYAEEYLSTLMHGVRYGGDYSLMTADYETEGGNPDYDAILASQFDRYDEDEQEGSMIIDVTKNALDLYDVTVTVDNTVTYEGEDLDISSLTDIQIQSHWGSGVEFRNVIVMKS